MRQACLIHDWSPGPLDCSFKTESKVPFAKRLLNQTTMKHLDISISWRKPANFHMLGEFGPDEDVVSRTKKAVYRHAYIIYKNLPDNPFNGAKHKINTNVFLWAHKTMWKFDVRMQNQLCETRPNSKARQSFAEAVKESTDLPSNPWDVTLMASAIVTAAPSISICISKCEHGREQITHTQEQAMDS